MKFENQGINKMPCGDYNDPYVGQINTWISGTVKEHKVSRIWQVEVLSKRHKNFNDERIDIPNKIWSNIYIIQINIHFQISHSKLFVPHPVWYPYRNWIKILVISKFAFQRLSSLSIFLCQMNANRLTSRT